MGKAWLWSLGGAGGYVTMTVITAILFISNDVNRPILRSLLWPISLVRYLLGGL
jgi:uncharacterized MAPEG superfamily protein